MRASPTLLALIVLALVFNPITAFVVARQFQNFQFAGQGMEPTHSDGDKVLLRLGDDPARGDVIAFTDPRTPSEVLAKRVIGMPHEAVSIEDGEVLIDGDELDEPYVESIWGGSMESREVPQDSFFVLGDNRNNSLDSRSDQIGFVARDQLVGHVAVAYWPADGLEGMAFWAVLLAIVLTSFAVIVVTGWLARKRGRSVLWAGAAWVAGAPGLLLVYLLPPGRKLRRNG